MTSTFGDYAIIVYGGTFSGVAAARQATDALDDRSILVINPQPGWGGVGGVGSQNAWDTRVWQHDGESLTPQGGSFREWYRTSGQAFDPGEMQERLRGSLESATDVDVLDFWDVTAVVGGDGDPIEGVKVAPLKRVERETRLSGEEVIVEGEIFVDASESGRLSDLAGVPLSVGRSGWADDSRQMAATLMFKMTDVDWQTITQSRSPNGQQSYGHTTDDIGGKRLFWGGYWTVKNSPAIQEFNESFPRFRIKAPNAAEGSDGEFWFNALMIYDVDGRHDARDRGKILPRSASHSPWDVDRARNRANEVLADPTFEVAMRSFPGLERASFVPDDSGAPLSAERLYLRETVHAKRGDGFALERDHVVDAGSGPDDGADAVHYDSRIGLCYYWLANNGYRGERPPDASELYATENPVYVPYEALTTPYCENLLIPGYAASVSSQAWFQMRVLPNLCVLGDAAGVAAAASISRGVAPDAFEAEDVSAVQRRLWEDADAILDKDTAHGVVA